LIGKMEKSKTMIGYMFADFVVDLDLVQVLAVATDLE
jgi:hypothetical protein